MMAIFFWLSAGLILYTYLGYPLLLTLVARVRPAPPVYPFTTPAVTMLIAAYNEQAVIARKLENSLSLDYPFHQLQILVAADGSDDHTVEIVRQYTDQGVELVYQPQRRGKMAAINRAMAFAKGEIVIFSDANNLYEPSSLHHLVAPFTDPRVGAVSGAKTILQGDGLLGESEGLYWKYESFIKKQENRLGTCTGVAGEILAIRRSLFQSPPQDIINDDFYMAMQIIQQGYRVVYAPQARSFERVSLSAQDEMTRRSRINAGRYQALTRLPKLLPRCNPVVWWQVISHKFLRPLVPFAMLGALLASLLTVLFPVEPGKKAFLRLAPPYNWISLILQALFYGLAVSGNRLEYTNSKAGKTLYMPTFLLNSNVAALQGCYRFFARQETPQWKRVRRPEEILANKWGNDGK
ncbi:MAG: glycosyltransferase family 2 protein [Chloroflexi bacterium]|nr:glycosyltransferase family 2 protein [Chloroflexota bacterium]